MATASVFFEQSSGEAGGVEPSCGDYVIRDTLTHESRPRWGTFDALLSFCAVR